MTVLAGLGRDGAQNPRGCRLSLGVSHLLYRAVQQLNTSVGLIRDTELCLWPGQMQPPMLRQTGTLGSGPGQENGPSSCTDRQSCPWQGQQRQFPCFFLLVGHPDHTTLSILPSPQVPKITPFKGSRSPRSALKLSPRQLLFPLALKHFPATSIRSLPSGRDDRRHLCADLSTN